MNRGFSESSAPQAQLLHFTIINSAAIEKKISNHTIATQRIDKSKEGGRENEVYHLKMTKLIDICLYMFKSFKFLL